MRHLGQMIAVFASTVLVSTAYAGPSSFSYEGRLYDSSGNPSAATVKFVVAIANPSGTCILRQEETASMDLSATDGYFSINVGTNPTVSGDVNLPFTTIFSNQPIVMTGDSSCSYTPSAGDGRILQVSVDDGVAVTPMTPAVAIGSAPFASVADALNGVPSANILQVSPTATGGSYLTPTQFVSLQSLVAGSSSLYMPASGTVQSIPMPVVASNPSSPPNGSIWYNSTSGNLQYQSSGGVQVLGSGGGGTVTSITAGSGLTGGTISSTGTIALSSAGTAGTYTKVTTDAYGRVVSGTTLTATDIPMLTGAGSVSGSAINSGTISGSTAISISGPISTTGAVTTGAINSGAIAASGAVTSTGGFSTTGSSIVGGNVGIGTTAPSAALQLRPGVAAAGGSPLKLMPGVNLTTPEVGAIEFDGTSLYYTDSTSTRRTLGVAGAGITALTGDVSASGAGSVSSTVNSVGGVTATSIGAMYSTVQAATNANTFSALVKRDAAGGFIAGTASLAQATYRDSGSNFATIQAPATVSTSYTLKLPAMLGTNGQALTTDATGNLSWTSIATTGSGSANTFGVGSIGTPAVNFYGDSSTGLYDPVNGTIAVASSGMQAMTINNLGTSITPTTASTSSTSGALIVAGGLGVAGTANVGTSITSPQIYGSSLSSGNLYLDSTSNATKGAVALAMSGGNVGVGTTVPAARLEVDTGAAATKGMIVKGAAGQTADLLDWENSSGVVLAAVSAAGNFISAEGTAAAPSLTFYSDAASGMWNPSVGTVAFSTSSTERMRVSSAGNVGIANTAPSALLDVGTPGGTLGTMRLEGNTSGYVQIQPAAAAGSWSMTLPASAGASGQVMATNGSGTLSWMTPAVSGGSNTFATGTAAAPAINFTSDTTSGLYDLAPGVGMTVSGLQVASFTSTGETLAANDGLTMASGTGQFTQTYTGTTTPARTLNANSVTTVAADSVTANGLTSGSILSLSSTSTATTASGSNSGINISMSGANTNASATRYGQYTNVTATGATSTNVGGYFSASGASNNYGLIVANGNVGIGITTPYTQLANTSSNTLDAGGAGSLSGSTAINWSMTNSGYVATLYNGSSTATASGLLIKGAGNTTNSLLSIDYGASQSTAGTALFRVLGNGNVGIGTTTPTSPLQIVNTSSSTALTITDTVSTPSQPNVLVTSATTLVTEPAVAIQATGAGLGLDVVNMGTGPALAVGTAILPAAGGIHNLAVCTGTNTSALSPTSSAAASFTITSCSGAPVGASVHCSPSAAPSATTISWSSYITTTGTININAINTNSSGTIAASTTWTCLVAN